MWRVGKGERVWMKGGSVDDRKEDENDTKDWCENFIAVRHRECNYCSVMNDGQHELLRG